MKLAYLSRSTDVCRGSERILDPYDLMQAELTDKAHLLDRSAWLGKVWVDSWLTPRPEPRDLPMLASSEIYSFWERNGCWDYALRVAEFIEKQVLPYKPVMIGVDHSSTAGSLVALAKLYHNLNVIVLDAHFDVMKHKGFILNKYKENPQFCHCGNFLAHVLERKIIKPENLWILGIADEVSPESQQHFVDMSGAPYYSSELERWIDRGVHVQSKKAVTSERISIDLNGPTYISIDMDIGSLSSVFSARFMNCYGLSVKEISHLLSRIGTSIKQAGVPLVGLDIMEVDIHFLEAVEAMPFDDCTKDIIETVFRLSLDRGLLS
ncbi:MAG: arginase family protein [Dehalococcoidia bacterium]|nr:arginase family protein [Dehalococcoidia bacterium]